MRFGLLVTNCFLLGCVVFSPAAYAGGYENMLKGHTAGSMMSPGSEDPSDSDDGDTKNSLNTTSDYAKEQQALEQKLNDDDEKLSLKNFRKTLDAMSGDQTASTK